MSKIVFEPISVQGPILIPDAIPEYGTDPTSPKAQDAWVLRTGSGASIADGTPIGMLLALTYTGNAGVAFSYQFSYRTTENTTVRTTLS